MVSVRLLAVVCALAMSATLALEFVHDGNINNVFSDDELKQCYKFRTPNIIRTPGYHHIVARCCGKNMCGGSLPGGYDGEIAANGTRLGDDDSECSVVMKSSTDGGNSWSNFQTVSPNGQSGYSNGGGFYEDGNGTLTVMYNKWEKDQEDRVYVIKSTDHGHSWTKPNDVTNDLNRCIPRDKQHKKIQSIGAGSKMVLKGGSLITYHHGYYTSVYLGSDGGNHWRCSNPFKNDLNEISFAQYDGSAPYTVVAAVRNDKKSPQIMTSRDNGNSWSDPQTPDGLPDTNCEGSLLGVGSNLFFGTPTGSKSSKNGPRSSMKIYCSQDGGNKWSHSISINGDAGGAYSDMKGSGKDILFAWGDNTHGNIFTTIVDPSFCN